MVVGGGDGYQLADAHLAQAILGCARELGGVVHGAHADDGALALGQAWHGVAGADAAWVGQRDGHAGEVVHRQLAFAAAVDNVLVLLDELAEGHLLGFLDGSNHQGTLTVLAHHVDGQTQVDVLRGNEGRLAVYNLVGVVHIRVGLDGLHQGVTDDVSKANLAATARTQGLVDHRTVFEHQLRRHIAHGRSRRDFQGSVHVLNYGPCGAPNGELAGLRCLHRLLRSRRGGALRGGLNAAVLVLGCRTLRLLATRRRIPVGGDGVLSGALAARGLLCSVARRSLGVARRTYRRGIFLKVIAPFSVDRLWVFLVLLVHQIDQPLVLTEICAAHSRSSPLSFMTLSLVVPPYYKPVVGLGTAFHNSAYGPPFCSKLLCSPISTIRP